MIAWILSSSLLILAMIPLRQLLQNKISHRLQYALWGIVLARLLLPFSIGETAISFMNAAKVSSTVQEMAVLDDYDKLRHTTDGTVEAYHTDELMPDTPHVVAVDKSYAEFKEMKQYLSLRDSLTMVWMAGTGVMLAVFVCSNIHFRRRLHRTCRGGNLPPDINCPLPVYITAAVDSPCLFGLLRPAIYLPPAVWAEPLTCRHAVTHEETHHRHRDHVWAVLRCLALSLHWYNPLVWWAVRLSRQDSELACDEGTIARLGEAERIQYGHTLLDLTCAKAHPLCTATTMLNDKGQLKERIVSIACSTKPRKVVIAIALATALILSISAFTGSDDLRPADTNPPAQTVELHDDGTGIATIPVSTDDLHTAIFTVHFAYEPDGEDYNITEILEVTAKNHSGWGRVEEKVTVNYDSVVLSHETTQGKALIPITYYTSVGNGMLTNTDLLTVAPIDSSPHLSPDFQLTQNGEIVYQLKSKLGEETIVQLDYDVSDKSPFYCSSDNANVALISYLGANDEGTHEYSILCTGVGHAMLHVTCGNVYTTIRVVGTSQWAEPTPTPDYETLDVVQPEDFTGLYQLSFLWENETLFNTTPNSGHCTIQYPSEKVTFIEELMKNSTPLTEAPGCPMGVSMEVYTRSKHFTIELPSDSCPYWHSNGVYYRYEAPDNTELYSLFSGGTIWWVMGNFGPWELFPLLPYLNWTHFESAYGVEGEGVTQLMDMLRDGVIYCDDIPTRVERIKLVLQCTNGLKEEHEAYFGQVLSKICDVTPGRFATALFEDTPAQNREIVIRLLAAAWDTDIYQTRSALMSFYNLDVLTTPQPTPKVTHTPSMPVPTPPATPCIGTWKEISTIDSLGVNGSGTVEMEQTVIFNEDGSGTWSTTMGDHPAMERSFTFGYRRDNDRAGQVTLFFDDSSTENYIYVLTEHSLLLASNGVSVKLSKVE